MCKREKESLRGSTESPRVATNLPRYTETRCRCCRYCRRRCWRAVRGTASVGELAEREDRRRGVGGGGGGESVPAEGTRSVQEESAQAARLHSAPRHFYARLDSPRCCPLLLVSSFEQESDTFPDIEPRDYHRKSFFFFIYFPFFPISFLILEPEQRVFLGYSEDKDRRETSLLSQHLLHTNKCLSAEIARGSLHVYTHFFLPLTVARTSGVHARCDRQEVPCETQ